MNLRSLSSVNMLLYLSKHLFLLKINEQTVSFHDLAVP